jgi:hypothetical protein
MMVSCVMPTKDRRKFIKAAIDCYQKQLWPDKELVILDDGEDKVADCVPANDPSIHYHTCSPHTTGEKRNMVNALAKGEIICHFDDDDWSAPKRVTDQVDFLKLTNKQVVGYSNILYWDLNRSLATFSRSHNPNHIYGLCQCYYRAYWFGHRFIPTAVASDGAFSNTAAGGPSNIVATPTRQYEDIAFSTRAASVLAQSTRADMIVSRIHGTNVSPKPQLIIDSQLIPAGFWENERYRLNG